MRKCFGHIVAFAALALILLASCKEEDKVIPRDKLARIYAEMLVTDQWILNTPNVRKIADTSLVYEPILEKYGYDSDDYRRSMDHYMNDPERFARVFRETEELIDLRIGELEKKKSELKLLEQKRKDMEKFRPDLKLKEYFPYLGDKPYVCHYDSLAVEMDESNVYRLVSVETSDTLFDGVRIIIPEADTLASEPVDTVKAEPVYVQLDTARVMNDTKRIRNLRPLSKHGINKE